MNGDRGEGVRYRLLGPLELWDDVACRWVSVGPAKWRALLTLLLLNANQVVPAGRLVQELWRECLPATARKALQGYVWRLRQVLGARAGALETCPSGYLLVVGPGELDVDRFQELADQGRSALARGAFEEAAGWLRKALALWRGPALSGVASPMAAAAAARLEAHRMAVVRASRGGYGMWPAGDGGGGTGGASG